jgi:hypothetical protein
MTIGLSNWAVDLKNVGAIYPFQGTEYMLVIACVVFWLAWHVWQLASEGRDLKDEKDAATVTKANAAIDGY